MLRVRIDNHDTKVMPISLAQMIFDGRLDRHDRAKSSDGATEQPLEYALGASHLEALTEELLNRLRSMVRPSASAEDIDGLRVRVESLCQWHWDRPNIKARLLWSAAWLNELTERFEAAVGYYDAFLQTRCRESHLRLLAYNNRGVLCIRLGHLDGVQDLVRSAIPSNQSPALPSDPAGLPAACFNLLNVINVAIEVDNLTQSVDGELVTSFSQLPQDAKHRWLGVDLAGHGNASEPSRASDGTVFRPGNGDGHSPDSSILGTPGYRPLNRLTSNLARQALLLDGPPATDATEVEEPVYRLQLWGDTFQHDGRELAACPHDRYAEAAALLLGHQIPSSLTPQDEPGLRTEQLAEEELAEIENLVVSGQFDLARSRLEVQRKILVAMDRHGRRGDLLARVDAELLWIARSKKEFEQLHLQRACARLVAELEEFCKLTSLAPAERQLDDLRQQLDDEKARLGPQAGKELIALLDELWFRADRHLRRLRRLDIRKRIRPALRELRASWPADWSVPVPETAYAALAQCHLQDPSNQIEDWPRLREQIDAHQAHYHLRGALAGSPDSGIGSEKTEAALAKALTLWPEAWQTIAPFFGLPADPSEDANTDTAAGMRTALETTARRLFQPVPSDSNPSGSEQQQSLLARALPLLDRSLRGLHDDPKRFMRLWHCLHGTLASALADASLDRIAAIKTVTTKCLDHWPARHSGLVARSDPRNPVRLFLDSCEKSRCLATAEELLDTEPPKTKEALEYVTWAAKMGFDNREQVRRAAAVVYLAKHAPQEDTTVQRKALDLVDAWAARLRDDVVRGMEERDIANEIAAIKTRLRS